MKETWRRVPGFPDYEVSDTGVVRSHKGPAVRVLRPAPHYRTGHLRVGLSQGGKTHGFYVHQLVLLAFVGPRPEGTEVCHNDDEPHNNALSNLRYDTRSANRRDSVRSGNHHETRKTECYKGHKFDDENTYVKPSGERVCRTCKRANRRAEWARKASGHNA